MELWESIKDYESSYRISDCGNVKSLKRNKEKLLKSAVDNSGYLMVTLCENGKTKIHNIHTLVWDRFGDEPRNGRKLQVDHKDENKLNNHIDNLQLLTPRQNITKSRALKRKNGLPTGVSWRERDKKYTAQIRINGRLKFLGHFDCPTIAKSAYQKQLIKIGEL